jgi:hypothetical protein
MGILSAAEKLGRIYDGWKNVVFPSAIVEKLAKVRADICSRCDYAEESEVLGAIIGEPIKEIKGFFCTKCNCPLSSKVRSVAEECPLRPPKW